MPTIEPVKKRDFLGYRIQLQLLSNYLRDRKRFKIPLMKNEFKMRLDRTLRGIDDAGLTAEELKIIEVDKKKLRKEYDRPF